jgi:hypothetical protein
MKIAQIAPLYESVPPRLLRRDRADREIRASSNGGTASPTAACRSRRSPPRERSASIHNLGFDIYGSIHTVTSLAI